jgi:hypothetical protein
MTPDLNYSISTRNAQMREWWKRPEYIAERKAFVTRRPVCDRCGRPATTPGHSHEDYRDFETYLDAVKTDKCDALCSACNRMERSGRQPCPSCVEKHKQDPEASIHYIRQGQDRCRYCEPGYDREAGKYRHERSNRTRNEINRNRYARAHPTVKRVVGGKWVELPR